MPIQNLESFTCSTPNLRLSSFKIEQDDIFKDPYLDSPHLERPSAQLRLENNLPVALDEIQGRREPKQRVHLQVCHRLDVVLKVLLWAVRKFFVLDFNAQTNYLYERKQKRSNFLKVMTTQYLNEKED